MVRKLRRSVSKRLTRLFGRFLLIDRDHIAAAYLAGDGIEIGALHNPLKVPRSARVRYVDNVTADEARRRFEDVRGEALVPVDILDDGERLATVADASLDFVVANHFIEHCENPFGAFRNMMRVLRPGGVLYLAVPDKRYTFDRDRPSTPVEHLRQDDRDGPGWSRRAHLEEWARVVEGVRDEAAARARVDALLEAGVRIHYHVWNQHEILAWVSALREDIPFEIEMLFKRKNETILVLRKGPPSDLPAVPPPPNPRTKPEKGRTVHI